MARLTAVALAVVAVSCQLGISAGRVAFAGVLPHGDFVLAPELLPSGTPGRRAAEALRTAAAELGVSVSKAKLDVLVLVSPHAVADASRLAALAGTAAAGGAFLGQDLHNASAPGVNVSWAGPLDAGATAGLVEALGEAGGAATQLSAFGGAYPFQLGWGEVVPLRLLERGLKAGEALPPLVVLSLPTSRLQRSGAALVPELLRLGAVLGGWAQRAPGNIGLLVSGDLAHTFRADGPYGFSEAAAPFDDAVARWAATLDGEALLTVAAALVPDALSCGFPGLVLMHAALRDAGGACGFGPRLLVRAAPTYYGMMVAEATPSSTLSCRETA